MCMGFYMRIFNINSNSLRDNTVLDGKYLKLSDILDISPTKCMHKIDSHLEKTGVSIFSTFQKYLTNFKNMQLSLTTVVNFINLTRLRVLYTCLKIISYHVCEKISREQPLKPKLCKDFFTQNEWTFLYPKGLKQNDKFNLSS